LLSVPTLSILSSAYNSRIKWGFPMDEEFRLIEESVSKRAGRSKSVVYSRILSEFVSSTMTSVRVEIDKKPATIYQQLLKTIKEQGTQGVKIVRRGEKVYLVKE
jgi:hypothetical protein